MQGDQRKDQFVQEVFHSELEEIDKRRDLLKIDKTLKTDDPSQRVPSTNLKLVGLSLSGGGIRSATFSLGVIQALAKHNVLKAIDYLSTVSGGGYIGSCLSSLLNTEQASSLTDQTEKFPLRYEVGVEEPIAVTHLRNSGNYLAPKGFIDKFRILALGFRGILSNFFIFSPIIILAAMLTEVSYENVQKIYFPFRNSVQLVVFGVLSLFIVLVLSYPVIARIFNNKSTWKRRDMGESILTVSLLAILFVFIVMLAGFLINQAIQHSWSDIINNMKLIVQHPLDPKNLWKWVVMLAVLILFMFADKASSNVSKLRGKLFLYLLGLVGPAIIILIYLLIIVLQVDYPFIDTKKLFSFRLSPQESSAMIKDQKILETFLKKFAENGQSLYEDAEIVNLKEGAGWLIINYARHTDYKQYVGNKLPYNNQTYLAKREGDKLSIYSDFEYDLNHCVISPGLRNSFKSKEKPLSENAKIISRANNNKSNRIIIWLIEDPNMFSLFKQGDQWKIKWYITKPEWVTQIQADLNQQLFPDLLRKAFVSRRVDVSGHSSVFKTNDNTWQIVDTDRSNDQNYEVRLKKVEETSGFVLELDKPIEKIGNMYKVTKSQNAPKWLLNFFRSRGIFLTRDAEISEVSDNQLKIGYTYTIIKEHGEFRILQPLSEKKAWNDLWNTIKTKDLRKTLSQMDTLLYTLSLLDDNLDKYFLIALIIFSVYFLLSNVNNTSMHNFYRDRLSRAYLFQINKESQLEYNDRQKLSTLNQKGTAPYHLINLTLNLQGSTDPNLRGRNGDFFIFSKKFTGSERTGFLKTEYMEKLDRHLDLGTAMAISGAAASPNMGITTVKPLVFIMTLLNIRLGYWLPNPASMLYRVSMLRRMMRPLCAGPLYLFREALGEVDDQSSYINVSDGGHLENLGVYELLRRRCKFIIAVDAETDPDLAFHGLAKLIRYARIDMGIEIKINLSAIRKNKEGLSQKNWALGEIRYAKAKNETGYLLYLKSSLSGDEKEYIRAYRASHPDFPHESTTDQFFSEEQFEAYRELGYHIANKTFRNREEIGEFSELIKNTINTVKSKAV